MATLRCNVNFALRCCSKATI